MSPTDGLHRATEPDAETGTPKRAAALRREGNRLIADDPAVIAELIEFCETGQIYAVERWIADGRPLQIAHEDTGWRRTPPTPLAAAIERDQYDLTRLLLCNGYDPELEPRSILNLVLERKAWDLLELAIDWGADPARADPDAVLGTYEVAIMERFWAMGNDFTRGRNLAWYLATVTSNKPAYGWAKRHHKESKVAKALALAVGAVRYLLGDSGQRVWMEEHWRLVTYRA
jgi:hypothetical protein